MYFMKRKLPALTFASLFVLGIMYLSSGVAAQSAPASQTGGSKPAGEKTAGEVFKNIQVLTDLKDATTTEFFAAMQFMSGSLSVSCNYCHVSQRGPWESDANKIKQIARDMIKLTRAINETNFGGRQVVTCNTCHQGSTHPKATPTPWYKTSEQIAAYNKSVQSAAPNDASAARQPVASPTESPAALPDVDQVMANYRKAVGADSLKSIQMSGTIETFFGGTQPFQFSAILPDKIVIGAPGNGAQQVFNGDHGWRVTSSATIPLTPEQFAVLKARADFFLPIKYQKSEPTRKMAGIERVGDKLYYVLQSHTREATERVFFDVQSGLLYKVRFEVETRLGTRVEETTYEDYRDVKGAKVASLIIFHYMEDQFLYRISEIQTNIALDPAKFEPSAPKERASIKLDPKILDAYAGEYQLTPTSVLTVTREGDRFFLTQPTGQQKFEVFAETETAFFLKAIDAEITFVKNEKGEVTNLVLHQGGINREMKKVK